MYTKKRSCYLLLKAQKLTIAVKNEKIAGLFSPDINLSAKERVDFSGKIIFPGLSIPMLMLHSAAILIPSSYTAASGGLTTLVGNAPSLPPHIPCLPPACPQ